MVHDNLCVKIIYQEVIVMTNSKQIYDQLSRPFPSKYIQWRVGSTNADKTKGTALAYIDSRAVIDRLNEVFGLDGWEASFIELAKGGILCQLRVNIGGNWITKTDGANFSDIESIKGGISDALKRAAVHLGIGRYLYDLDSPWVELRNGRYIAQNPQLPDWALPEEERGKAPSQRAISTQSNSGNHGTQQQPQQDMNPDTFRFSGGKCAGMTLAQAPRDYLEWIVNKSSSKQDLKDMVSAFLSSTEIQVEEYEDPFLTN